jgi:hypothetical protein
MSTKAIRAALDRVSEERGEGIVREAIKELEAIERAAKAWVTVDGQPGPGRMKRLDELLRSIAKEAP